MNKDSKLQLAIVTRELRLIYYNDYLFESKVITQREHEKMNNAIISMNGNKRSRTPKGPAL